MNNICIHHLNCTEELGYLEFNFLNNMPYDVYGCYIDEDGCNLLTSVYGRSDYHDNMFSKGDENDETADNESRILRFNEKSYEKRHNNFFYGDTEIMEDDRDFEQYRLELQY